MQKIATHIKLLFSDLATGMDKVHVYETDVLSSSCM